MSTDLLNIELIGFVAACLTSASFLPQAIMVIPVARHVFDVHSRCGALVCLWCCNHCLAAHLRQSHHPHPRGLYPSDPLAK